METETVVIEKNPETLVKEWLRTLGVSVIVGAGLGLIVRFGMRGAPARRRIAAAGMAGMLAGMSHAWIFDICNGLGSAEVANEELLGHRI